MANHQLSLFLLLPFLGLLLLLTIKEQKLKLIRTISAIATGLQLWILILLLFSFDRSANYLQFVDHFSWINILSIDFIIGLDGISFPFLILSNLMFFLTIFIAWNIEQHPKSFFTLLMTLDIGISGILLSFDLFLFIMFFGITLFSLYLLISLFTGKTGSNALRHYGISALLSFCLIITGILLITINNSLHSFNLSVLANNLNPSAGIQIAGFLVLLLGFLLISPVLPFHTWIINIIRNINTPIAIIILALFSKISIFGILHIVMPLFPNTARNLALIFGIIGIVNLLYFALCVYSEAEYRKITVYYTGYLNAIMFIGLSIVLAIRYEAIDTAVTGLNSVILQAFTAGLLIPALFILPKLQVSTDNSESSQWALKFTSVFVLLAAIGIPGFQNFIAQFLCALAAFQIPPTRILIIIAMLGPLLIGIRFFNIINAVIKGNTELDSTLKNDCCNVYVITIVLLGILIFNGLFPGFFIRIIQQSVHFLINHLI